MHALKCACLVAALRLGCIYAHAPLDDASVCVRGPSRRQLAGPFTTYQSRIKLARGGALRARVVSPLVNAASVTSAAPPLCLGALLVIIAASTPDVLRLACPAASSWGCAGQPCARASHIHVAWHKLGVSQQRLLISARPVPPASL